MMKRFRQVFLIYTLVIGMFLSITGTIMGSQPTIGDITLNPKHPTLQSDVTFSVNVNGDNISLVRIIVGECNKAKGLCHAPPQNISMSKSGDNTYIAKVTLQWDDVTSITYHVAVKSNGIWISFEDHNTTLTTDSGNSEADSNDSKGTPGFEIIGFFLAVIVVVLLFKKFKSR
jgi:hypothetical protein